MDDMIIDTTPAPQIVYAPDGYILGITSPDLGVEVTTEYNCSACWLDDAPAYYLDGDTVRETTAAEREAWVEAHKATETVDPATENALAIAELAEEQEAFQTNTELALAELAELIQGGIDNG